MGKKGNSYLNAFFTISFAHTSISPSAHCNTITQALTDDPTPKLSPMILNHLHYPHNPQKRKRQPHPQHTQTGFPFPSHLLRLHLPLSHNTLHKLVTHTNRKTPSPLPRSPASKMRQGIRGGILLQDLQLSSPGCWYSLYKQLIQEHPCGLPAIAKHSIHSCTNNKKHESILLLLLLLFSSGLDQIHPRRKSARRCREKNRRDKQKKMWEETNRWWRRKNQSKSHRNLVT